MIGSFHNQDPTEKWFIPLVKPGEGHPEILWALVDTGSSKSYIGDRGLSTISCWNSKSISVPPFTAVVANGEQCPINKAYVVSVKLAKRNIKTTLHYLPNLTTPAIFGLDIILSSRISLGCDSTWWFGDEPELKYRFHSDLPIDARSEECSSGIQLLSGWEQRELGKIVTWGMNLLDKSSGKTNLIAHKIDTGLAKPIKLKAYRYSPRVLEAMYAELDNYIKEGIVEPSHSEWASPVVMVKREDKYRFCVDFRKVNAVSKRDSYPMPNMTHLLDSLRQAKYLSKIDLKQAFLQVPLADKHSRDVTSFIVPGRGLFRFTMMPFGLTGSPATFQRLADMVFGPELFPHVVVYLDDLLICTPDFSTHCKMVEEVFSRLSKAGLRVNKEKCEFGCSEVRYLGFLVNGEGMCADPERVASVVNFPVPHNQKTLRRFLGMAGWYRRYIKDFSTIISPLSQLLKKKTRWRWEQPQADALYRLKQLLTSAPVLARPDFTQPFTLKTDASNVGLGAVLTQIQSGEEKVIAYSSRTLTSCEKNYSVTEKECLAVLWGIAKHRHYLEGYRFTVVTDHSSLKWLLNLKDPTGRLARWALQLQEYDFEIEYRKGVTNVVADALSRIPEGEMLNSLGNAEHTGDPWYERKFAKVLENPDAHPDWMVRDGELYFHRVCHQKEDLEDESERWKLVVPKGGRNCVLEKCHDREEAGHLGISKTHWRVARVYYWPGMYHDILRYVRHCLICQKTKPSNSPPRGLMNDRDVQAPWQCVAADLMGPFPRSSEGNTYLLVFQDLFSRWVELVPIRRATSEVIVGKFRSVILNRYGTPDSLITDNGSNFVSSKMKSLLDSLKIKHIKTPFYHSQANPVERSNRNIRQLIVAYLGKDHKRWDQYLGEFQLALNSVKQDSTKYSPAFLNFGRELRVGSNLRTVKMEVDEESLTRMHGLRDQWGERMAKLKEFYHLVEENLTKANRIQRDRYNLRRRIDPYKVGDMVLKRTFYPSSAGSGVASKLYPKYEGPFEVVEVSPSGCCRLRDSKGRSIGLWHSSKLKLFNTEKP